MSLWEVRAHATCVVGYVALATISRYRRGLWRNIAIQKQSTIRALHQIDFNPRQGFTPEFSSWIRFGVKLRCKTLVLRKDKVTQCGLYFGESHNLCM